MLIPKEIGGYSFKNTNLLKKALTHSSYANENKLESNERLEFLGDAVLDFISAEYLYENYRDYPEGELTKLRAAVVCEQSLCKVALDIGLGDILMLGHGEEANGGRHRPSMLADAVEAVLAAVYLDGGFEKAKIFAMPFIEEGVKNIEKGKAEFIDYKTLLQEIVQKNRGEILKYSLKSETGPAHDRHFTVELFLNSNLISVGEGKSKKEAEQNAAKAALALMGEQ